MIIFLVKGKLQHIDNIAPILAEIRAAKILCKIKLIIPSQKDYQTLKKNVNLFSYLSTETNIMYFKSTSDYRNKGYSLVLSKILSIIQRNIVLYDLLIRKVILFRIELVPLIGWLISLNKLLFGSKEIAFFTFPIPFNIFISTTQERDIFNRHFDLIFKRKSDLFLSSFSKNELKKISFFKYDRFKDFMHIGNPRRWNAWRYEFFKKFATNISELNQDFIFFPLAVIKRSFNMKAQGDVKIDFEGSIKLILSTIRKNNKKIKIIFKPHPTTDMSLLKSILKQLNLKNYLICNFHYIPLIKKSLFVVRYATSTIDDECWVTKKYLIRYHYKEMAKHNFKEIEASKKVYSDNNFADVFNPKQLNKSIKKGLKMKSSTNFQEATNLYIKNIKNLIEYLNNNLNS